MSIEIKTFFMDPPPEPKKPEPKKTLEDVFEYYKKMIPPACMVSCSPIMMLAHELGIHPNSIRNWMNRPSGVPYLRAKQIKRITGIDILGGEQ